MESWTPIEQEAGADPGTRERSWDASLMANAEKVPELNDGGGMVYGKTGAGARGSVKIKLGGKDRLDCIREY